MESKTTTRQDDGHDLAVYTGETGCETADARITTDHATSSYGIPVLIVESNLTGGSDVVYGPAEALAAHVRVERATKADLRDLRAGGYGALVDEFLTLHNPRTGQHETE